MTGRKHTRRSIGSFSEVKLWVIFILLFILYFSMFYKFFTMSNLQIAGLRHMRNN